MRCETEWTREYLTKPSFVEEFASTQKDLVDASHKCNHNWQSLTLFTSIVENCSICGAKK
jgi:hypothetical protein